MNNETYKTTKVIDFEELIELVTTLVSNGYELEVAGTNFEVTVDNVTLIISVAGYNSYNLDCYVEVNVDEIVESTLGVTL